MYLPPQLEAASLAADKRIRLLCCEVISSICAFVHVHLCLSCNPRFDEHCLENTVQASIREHMLSFFPRPFISYYTQKLRVLNV